MVGVRWERYMCILRKTCINLGQVGASKAIYLFQATPCAPCGTVLFRTNPIYAKRMRRLVSVGDQKISELVALIFFKLLICDKETRKVLKHYSRLRGT